MIILMTVLMIASLIILVFKHRSNFTYMFVSKLVLINIFLLLTTFFIIKTANFTPVFTWESSMYFILSKIKINYYTLFDMFILAITAYMMVSLIMAVNMLPAEKKHMPMAIIAIGMIPLLVFLYLNIYDTGSRIHFAVASGRFPLLNAAVQYLNVFNAGILLLYALLPFGAAVISLLSTKIRYKRRYTAVICVCMLAVDALAVAVLWIAPHKSLLFYAPDFLKNPNKLALYINPNYTLLLIVGMGLLGVFTYFAATKEIFDNINLNSIWSRPRQKKSKIYFKDTRPVSHTYKNTLLSIDLLAKGLEQKNPPQEIKDGIAEMRCIIEESLTQLVRLLDIYNDPNEIIETTDIVECIQNAAERADIPKDIAVRIAMPAKGVSVSADGVLLEEVFVNLFKNSCEAILQKPQQDAAITIKILTEGNWCCTYFRDSGCGILRKDYKNIFKPLYSTKKTSKNWGIGLSFVSNVIMSIGGKITVKSKKDEYTEFEILLPMEWQCRKNKTGKRTAAQSR